LGAGITTLPIARAMPVYYRSWIIPRIPIHLSSTVSAQEIYHEVSAEVLFRMPHISTNDECHIHIPILTSRDKNDGLSPGKTTLMEQIQAITHPIDPRKESSPF
jgi:hypothetical protein